MRKILIVFVGLATVAFADEFEDDDGLDSFEDLNDTPIVVPRSWIKNLWKKGVKTLKNTVSLDDLSCLDTTCTTCLRVVSKQGCFGITYNRNNGQNGFIDLKLSVDSNTVFQTSVPAGNNPASRCVSLPFPIQQACFKDFNINVDSSGNGNICFGLGLNSYKVGAKYCIGVNGGKLTPDSKPSLTIM